MSRVLPRWREMRLTIGFCLCLGNFAHANIYKWEYINPADPSQGKQQSSILCPDGAGINAVSYANLQNRNLTMAYLIGANLEHANLYRATLTDADLSNANLFFALFANAILTNANFMGADVRYASFQFTVPSPQFGVNFTAAQLYSTASYQVGDMTGINLRHNYLTGWNFAGQNLSSADFLQATLDNANFSQAHLGNALFFGAYLTNANLSQADLSNTSFYSATLTNANLTGVNAVNADFRFAYLTNANLSQADLSNTNFYNATLTNANLTGVNAVNADFLSATLTYSNFSGADTRGAISMNPNTPINTNLIRPDGHIQGLVLTSMRSLVVRDYDGDPDRSIGPIPILVEQYMTLDSTGVLQMIFEEDAWDSLISFVPGISVTLTGTLQLGVAENVNIATQIGRTIRLFDWTGVSPNGTFNVVSPYSWDLSRLYDTGEITLSGLAGDYNGDYIVNAGDYVRWRNNLGDPKEADINFAGDGQNGVDLADYAWWKQHYGNPGSGSAGLTHSGNVPEPTSVGLFVMCISVVFAWRSIQWKTVAPIVTAFSALLCDVTVYAEKPATSKVPLMAQIAGPELVSLEDDQIKGSTIRIARFSPDGSVVVAAAHRSLLQWSTGNGKLLHKMDLGIPPRAKIQEIVVSHSNDHAAVVCSDDENSWIDVWDMSTGSRVCTFTWPKLTVGQIAFSANRDTLVVGLHPNQVSLLDVSGGGRWLRSIPGQADNIIASGNGKTVATSLGDRTLLWDALTGALDRQLPAVGTIGLSFDGQHVALFKGNTFMVWDFTLKKKPRPRGVHLKEAGGPGRFKLSPDGKLAAGVVESPFGGSSDPDPGLHLVLQRNDLCIWDLRTGRRVAKLYEVVPFNGRRVHPPYRQMTIDWNFRDNNSLLALRLEEFGEGREYAYAGGRVEGPVVFNKHGQGMHFVRYDAPGTLVLYDRALKLREYRLDDLNRALQSVPPKRKSHQHSREK